MPNFWTDPASGIPYYLSVQTPEHQVSSIGDLGNTPVSSALAANGDPVPGVLSNVATLTRDSVPTNANQANIQPVYDVYASIQGRDLGNVSDEINAIVAKMQSRLKPGDSIQIVGQIQSMNQSFADIGLGLLFAAVFVYLLMVVNYQTFGDPFVVILALPATFCRILTMLFVTGTTLNVPSLMGAIMAVGVASGKLDSPRYLCPRAAAWPESRPSRLRSMPGTRDPPGADDGCRNDRRDDPMAIGAAGEEQNAALARAVIGGLLFATPTTLLIVPYLFANLQTMMARRLMVFSREFENGRRSFARSSERGGGYQFRHSCRRTASPPASAATGHSACCQRHFDPRGRGCAGVMAQLRTISRGVVDSTTAPRFRADLLCCVDTIQR